MDGQEVKNSCNCVATAEFLATATSRQKVIASISIVDATATSTSSIEKPLGTSGYMEHIPNSESEIALRII